MSTPAGWYDDGQGHQRWWDGVQWTEHVQPPAQAQPVAPSSEAYDPAATQAYDAATQSYDPAATQSYDAAATQAYDAAAAQPQATQAYAPAVPPPTPAGSSKKWILWVVIGLVALMILGGALFFIISSLVSSMLSTSPIASPAPPAVSAPAEPGPSAEPGPDDTIAELTAAERAAAEDVVQRYDAAWSAGDCDEYFALTTEEFREWMELTDCATLEEASASFNSAVTDYTVTVDDAYRSAGYVVVETTETGNALLDDLGTPLEAPEAIAFSYVYELVERDGVLLIDYVADAS